MEDSRVLVTVFTPTYDRAYIIENLYNSLQRQTSKDFEWIVVDDGSNDNTESLFLKWQKEESFSIRYFKQENGGKHRAINRGVKEAHGDLFFIVDSDDYLENDAIEKISFHYKDIEDNKSFAGVCGLKSYPDGRIVSGQREVGILDCTSLDFRFKFKVHGDMAEVIRTDVMKEFPIPEFDGEFFCPEAVFFNRIAQKYKLRYFFEVLYYCDYLPDGLSAKITKLRMQSPCASMVCYSELTKYRIPITQKIKAAINYWRFYFCLNSRAERNLCDMSPLWKLLLPAGYAFHQIDKFNN